MYECIPPVIRYVVARRIRAAFLYAWVLSISTATVTAQDAIIVQPVITGPSAVLTCPERFGDDSIVAVWFHVRYSSVLPGTSRIKLTDTLLGLDEIAPFSTRWDCSGIEDQDDSRLLFYCDILTSTGEVKTGPTAISQRASLIRTSRTSQSVLDCRYTKRPFMFDGTLAEWGQCKPTTFAGGGNVTTVYAQWNERFLVLGVRVEDRTIVADETTPVQRQDGIEILIDPRADRSPARTSDDFRLVVAASGAVHIDAPLVDTSWRPITGISRDSSGYTIETGIEWSVIGMAPSRGARLGFALANLNTDDTSQADIAGVTFGIPALTARSPARWGTLVLRQARFPWAWIALALFIAAAAVLAYRRLPRRRRAIGDRENLSVTLQYVLDYLDTHCDGALDIDTIAAQFYLSPSALQRIIRTECRLSYQDFVLQFKVEKSQALLATTETGVAEISRTCGFATLARFDSEFIRSVGIGPAQFRARIRREKTAADSRQDKSRSS